MRKYGWRARKAKREGGPQRSTVAQVAQEIGRSPTTVQRLLREGLLRRFKDGIEESSSEALLREHPDCIPYGKLPSTQRELLVLNEYPDQWLAVKAPSVRGLLE